MSEPRRYTLETPIKVGSDEISEFEFRPLKGRDLRDLPVGGLTFEGLFKLAARVASVPDDDGVNVTPRHMDELDGADAIRVAALMGELMGDSPATGAGSSSS